MCSFFMFGVASRSAMVRASLMTRSSASVPAIECIFVTSNASSLESGGSTEAKAFASMVLPVPGCPIISML